MSSRLVLCNNADRHVCLGGGAGHISGRTSVCGCVRMHVGLSCWEEVDEGTDGADQQWLLFSVSLMHRRVAQVVSQEGGEKSGVCHSQVASNLTRYSGSCLVDIMVVS